MSNSSLDGGPLCMFTRDELRQHQQSLRQLDLLPVEVVYVGGGREESEAVIHRANKYPYRSPLHFWVNSLRVLEARRSTAFTATADVDAMLCQPITEQEFLQLLTQCLSSAIFAAKLRSLGKFRRGLWMTNEWDDKSAVAEIQGNYCAAYWLTFA